jgi:hypothetical protein
MRGGRGVISLSLSPTGPSQLNHCIPAQVHLNRAAPWVEWIDVRHATFHEPFFDQTVRRLAVDEGRPVWCGPFEDVCEAASSLSNFRLVGIIVHVSRCGSTMLCNALRSDPQALVLAEPQPLTELLACDAPDKWGKFASRAGRDEVRRSTLRLLGRIAPERQHQVVLKLESWTTLHLDAVRRLWPGVPIVLVIRHPVEVAVSILARPTWWLLRRQPLEVGSALDMSSDVASAVSAEAYVARILGAMCRTVERHIDERCLVVQYESLGPDAYRRIAKRFGLGPLDYERLRKSDSIYSKDTGRQAKFVADGEAKQLAASVDLRQAIARCAMPEYNRLLAKVGLAT